MLLSVCEWKKARVAPIKSVSIPRLELMAAILGVRLAETVSEKLEIPLSEHTLWTDSMGVIYWVQGHSRRRLLLIESPRSSEKQALHNGDTCLVRKTLLMTRQEVLT